MDPQSPEATPLILPFPERVTDRNSLGRYNKRDGEGNKLVAEHIYDLFHAMGWRSMIRRSGPYYAMLVKEFYTNMTQKTNKDAITIRTIVKGVTISFDKALLSQIASILDEGPSITFESTSTFIFGDT